MCYLWTCKRRKHILYYAVGDSELDEKEEIDGEGEIHCNPDATNPDTDDDIDSGISGEGKFCGANDRPAVRIRGGSSSALGLSSTAAAASAQVVLELKSSQAGANSFENGRRQETALVTVELEPGDEETDAQRRLSEKKFADYEEIPSLDALTIDWQSELPATFSSSEWGGATQHSGSLNLSDISDIA